VPLPSSESAPAATTNVQIKVLSSLWLSQLALPWFSPGAPASPAKPSANHTGRRASLPQSVLLPGFSLSCPLGFKWLLFQLEIIQHACACRLSAGRYAATVTNEEKRAMDQLRWEIFLQELLWIAPIVVGVICIGIAFYFKSKRPPIATVFLCFLMAILTIGVGAFGTWRGGLYIYEVLGVAGDITAEMMYQGWKNSWLSMIISGITTAFLFAIATKARLDWENSNMEAAA